MNTPPPDPLASARTVVVGGCDLNGTFRAKQAPAAGFAAAPPSVAFSDGIWAMDFEDALQPPPPGFPYWFPSWEDGYGDVLAVPDMATLRTVPWRPETAVVLGDFVFPDGRPVEISPREVLRRAIERLAARGFRLHVAPEFEFVLLRETEATLAQKGYRGIEALSPIGQSYGAARASADSEVLEAMRAALEEMGIATETWYPEGAPGQYEINLAPTDPLAAADAAFLFKQAVKEIAAARGLAASFMSRIGNGPGSGLHVHQSLRDESGADRCADPEATDGLSTPFRRVIGGQLASLRELSLLLLPTANDYKRSVENSAAGTTVTWGVDNKAVSLRLLPRGNGGFRVEHRVAGAGANVYLVLAALVAGAAHGLEREIEPPPAYDGNPYADPAAEPLPRSLEAAIDAFETSEVARDLLGAQFAAHYAATRRWEAERQNEHVSDWELRRYLLRT